MRHPSTVIAIATLVLAGCGGSAVPARTSHLPPARVLAPPPAPEPRADSPAPPPADSPAPTAFPAGWIRPADGPSPLPPPALGKTSLARLAADRVSPRVPLAPFTIRLADLPIVEVEPEPDWYKPPAGPLTGERPAEMFIADEHLAFRGKVFGTVSVSFLSGRGGAGLWCKSSTGYRQAAWASLSPLPNGDLQYRGATAWFDYQACRAHLVQRIETPARSIAAGLAFAFRTSCPRCAPRREQLHVLTPMSGWGGGDPFNEVKLPLGRGEGKSTSFRLSAEAIQTWRGSGARPERTQPTQLGVEVAQLTGEAEPVVLVYVADAPPANGF